MTNNQSAAFSHFHLFCIFICNISINNYFEQCGGGLTNLVSFFQRVELVTSIRTVHVNTGAIFCAVVGSIPRDSPHLGLSEGDGVTALHGHPRAVAGRAPAVRRGQDRRGDFTESHHDGCQPQELGGRSTRAAQPVEFGIPA